MIQLVLLSLLLFFSSVHCQSNEMNICLGRAATSEPVIQFCQAQNGSLNHRCCYATDSDQIIAIDLTEMQSLGVPELNSSIELIDLRLNPQLRCTPETDFLHLQMLNDLYLPVQYYCPGGNDVWKDIEAVSNSTGYRCFQQKDFCQNRTNICPEQRAFCNRNGPNHFLCLCRNGFDGYKCLRHGGFPFGRFIGAVTLITILISTVCYWTQRRNVRRN